LYRRQSRRDQELEAQKMDINTLKLKILPREIEDGGKVRIGNASPSFPAARTTPSGVADDGKVRIGNASPSFPPVRGAPAGVTDNGKVRIGNASPSFPPVR
jgi:hypothetical protein